MSKIVKTIGGDRLGAGKQRKVALRNYERSTHNLSELFQSSLGPGLLYPAYLNMALNGDSWVFDIKSALRTLPTVGPVFGNFKLQVDLFSIPIRLYNARLHNNPINVGMHMQNIKLPVASFPVLPKGANESIDDYINRTKCHASSLPHYLYTSGFGLNKQNDTVYRTLPAIKYLAYYDIFKNYYSNKQEDNFFFVTNVVSVGYSNSHIEKLAFYLNSPANTYITLWKKETATDWPKITATEGVITPYEPYYLVCKKQAVPTIFITEGSGAPINLFEYEHATVYTLSADSPAYTDLGYSYYDYRIYYIEFDENHEFSNLQFSDSDDFSRSISLDSQPLSTIDDLRDAILMTSKDSVFNLTEYAADDFDAFSLLFNYAYSGTDSVRYYYSLPMQGLICKTYQSDIFNAFMNKDFIEGVEGISAITKIDTTNGLEMDTLLMAEKVYNMLCQIAISGGTWEDWQEAVYGEKAIRRAETPIYLGGMSSIITFDEVVSNSASEIAGDVSPLGTIGGRGRQTAERGGKVVVKTREPSLIMAIASITPLDVVYNQGNTWIDDIFSPDDLHKPALDQIGYQDLIGEQMLWTDTEVDDQGDIHRHSYGKVPAWLNYMTAVNHAHGDFAEDEKKSFMTISRDYHANSDGTISDFTSYIDPKKFNYMFAYSDLDAQNFWLQILFDVKCRRKMSAKVIPNL